MKKNKFSRIFSILITLILLCTSVFVPFINRIQDKVFAENTNASNATSLYAFIAKQSNTMNGGKIYVNFGLSIDVSNDGVVTHVDAESMMKKDVPFESAKIYIRTRNMSALIHCNCKARIGVIARNRKRLIHCLIIAFL